MIGAAGITFSPMAGLTERAMARAARAPFPDMVKKLYDPGLTPYRLPGVERLTNLLEYFVHHEDLRRAQPGWEPRELPAADEDELWKLLPGSAKLATRKVGVPIVVRRSDRPGPARPRSARATTRSWSPAGRRSWCCSSSAATSWTA